MIWIYFIQGDFATWASELFLPDLKQTIPMVIEFGTMDSQTLIGAMQSIHRMILENQASQYGSRRDSPEIQQNFLEMFYPSSPQWREQVMQQAKTHLPVFFDRFRRY